MAANSSKKITLTQTEGLAAEADCVELVVPGVLVVESGTTRLDGEKVAYGLRLSMETIDLSDERERAIPTEQDDCGWRFDELPADAWKRDRTEATAPPAIDHPTFTREIEKETSGNLSVGVQINSVPVNLGIGFHRSARQQDTIDVWLAAGAAYAAYQPGAERTMEWCWTAK